MEKFVKSVSEPLENNEAKSSKTYVLTKLEKILIVLNMVEAS